MLASQLSRELVALDSTGEAQTCLHVYTEPRAGAGLEDLWERGQWSRGLKPGGLGRVGSAQQTADRGQLAPGTSASLGPAVVTRACGLVLTNRIWQRSHEDASQWTARSVPCSELTLVSCFPCCRECWPQGLFSLVAMVVGPWQGSPLPLGQTSSCTWTWDQTDLRATGKTALQQAWGMGLVAQHQ